MNVIDIAEIDDLIRKLNELPNNFIYRGHANAAWNLESSLERVIGAKWSSDNAKRFEDFSISHFQSKFHLYDRENIEPTSKLAWLSVMQHYGVPTRLIDFTESPYIALYFALEAYSPQSKADFAIFAIDYSSIMERSIGHICSKDSGFRETRETVYAKQDAIFDEVVDRFSYPIAWITEPRRLNVRLDRQAGCFLLSGDKGIRIKDVLDTAAYNGVCLYKFHIASSLYESIFALLRKMNITSKSLYGDLDGLARSIRMQMQIYSV
ncbi:FRG domain-containing protein [Burkholderia cepacia]|uniref:FRG domain-containing protein n=1 Tax=Burkholderia cepacia TaxID=292 RepID=UPI0009BDE870|nr:FRG domain-containing protein [Burkholderia cepacia]